MARSAAEQAPRRLDIGFIEPHLLRFGGIRRVIELANRLIRRGHAVTFFLPSHERMSCDWMRCDAKVRPLRDGYERPLDAIIFNEETQWHLPALFSKARHTVHYALHYARLYDKAGSWESIRLPVSLRLANSTWTADMIEQETGQRPVVLLGGINPEHFRPLQVKRRYPILCAGDHREWKGTDTIAEAARLLRLPLESYGRKNLAQDRLAAEYAAAEVFVVGSHSEGFGQPGLEALACGTPLVTTDNGGCRDYAIDGETALVVPPRDPTAMADAIARLRADADLAARLRENGLALVRERFDWAESALRLETMLLELDASPTETAARRQPLRETPAAPELSVVIPAWDQLHYTQRCVESIRQRTDVPYELILIDNGSEPETAAYASQAADTAILNDANLGFSKGMNQGLAAAKGRCVAFVNNDTKLPAGWASPLVEHLQPGGRTGIVVPAVTAAGNQRTVLGQSRDRVEVIPPFEAPPSAVIYVMEREVASALGGWGEEYEIASAEDVDLCFKVWVNGLDIVFDQRVLVDHVAKGTAGEKLGNYEQRWALNRQVLLTKWTSEDLNVPRLPSCSDDDHARNLQIARSVAGWMDRYFRARSRLPMMGRRFLRLARPAASRLSKILYRNRQRPWVARTARWIKTRPGLERLLRQMR